MKLADYVMDCVAKAGAKHVFMVPGGGAMHLNDALGRRHDLSFVANLHEHACAVAAEAYAKLSANLGVALVTAGPGSTNCVTGVTSAWVNSAPTLFISGQVKRQDLKGSSALRQLGLQEVDIVSIVRSITRYAVTVTEPLSIRFHMERALRLCRSGRPGPVWIDLPLDVQSADIDPEALVGEAPEVLSEARESHDAALTESVVAELAGWLAEASRPVFLMGAGVRIAGAHAQMLSLVKHLGIPVLTTWCGADLMADDHPLYAGRPGAFASRGANFTLQNADLLVSVGARWDLATTGFAPSQVARAARRVAVDIDPAELEKLSGFVDRRVCADAGDFLKSLSLATSGLELSARYEPWRARCVAWRERYPVVTPEMSGRSEGVSTYTFVRELSAQLAVDDVLVEGSAGIQSEVFFMAFAVKAHQRIIADGSLGAMGYGLPAALGACLASGRRTVLVDGDGSIMPNVQEFETLSRLKLPLKVFIVNNDGYGSIRVSQNRWFERLVAADRTSGLTLPELSGIAAAFGIRHLRVQCESELSEALREVLGSEGPMICEVMVPREEDRVPRLSNYQKPDGSIGSKPLEDLAPFLPRDEFHANMIIPPLPE